MQSNIREATVVRSQSRSDCFPILLNMQSHSREATVMPRRRGEAASWVYILYSDGQSWRFNESLSFSSCTCQQTTTVSVPSTTVAQTSPVTGSISTTSSVTGSTSTTSSVTGSTSTTSSLTGSTGSDEEPEATQPADSTTVSTGNVT